MPELLFLEDELLNCWKPTYIPHCTNLDMSVRGLSTPTYQRRGHYKRSRHPWEIMSCFDRRWWLRGSEAVRCWKFHCSFCDEEILAPIDLYFIECRCSSWVEGNVMVDRCWTLHYCGIHWSMTVGEQLTWKTEWISWTWLTKFPRLLLVET